MMTPAELEKAVAPEMEGNVYAHHYISFFMGNYSLQSTYYTVKNGIVYHISGNGKLNPSGNPLMTTKIECKLVGKYIEGDEQYFSHFKDVPYYKIKRFFK